MTETTDEDLLQRYLTRDDAAAFAELFRRYAGRIHGMHRRAGLPDELADELVQQAFLNVHRARHDFRAGSRFRPWLFAIAVNTRREHFRRRASRPESPVEDFTGFEPRVEPDASTPRARLLRRTLATLPADQREVIELHWFEGLSMDEIAQVVGAGLSAVKVRAHRGYQKLRRALDPE